MATNMVQEVLEAILSGCNIPVEGLKEAYEQFPDAEELGRKITAYEEKFMDAFPRNNRHASCLRVGSEEHGLTFALGCLYHFDPESESFDYLKLAQGAFKYLARDSPSYGTERFDSRPVLHRR